MKGTKGGTTSNTRTEDMKLDYLTLADGTEICVKPKPLVKQRVPKEKDAGTDPNQSKAAVGTSQSGNPATTGPKQTKDITTDA